MSNPMNTLRNSAAIAVLVLFGVSGAAAADDTVARESESAALDAIDWTAVATFRTPLAGLAEGEPADVHDDDRIAHGEAVRERLETPVEFTGIVGRYLTRRPPVPADYLDAVRVHGPDPWVGGFSDLW